MVSKRVPFLSDCSPVEDFPRREAYFISWKGVSLMGDKESSDKAGEREAAKDSAKESPMEKAYNNSRAEKESSSLWESIMGKKD